MRPGAGTVRGPCRGIRWAAAAARGAVPPTPAIGPCAAPRARTIRGPAGGWTPRGTSPRDWFRQRIWDPRSPDRRDRAACPGAGSAARPRVVAAGRGSGPADRPTKSGIWLAEHVDHYNTHRSHRSLAQTPRSARRTTPRGPHCYLRPSRYPPSILISHLEGSRDGVSVHDAMPLISGNSYTTSADATCARRNNPRPPVAGCDCLVCGAGGR